MFSHVWQEPCHVQIGAAVNLEVDIVGKYVERMMKGYNASVTSLAWRVLLKVFSIFWCIADKLPICCPMEGTKVQYTVVDVKTLCILQLHLCFWMILLCIVPWSKIYSKLYAKYVPLAGCYGAGNLWVFTWLCSYKLITEGVAVTLSPYCCLCGMNVYWFRSGSGLRGALVQRCDVFIMLVMDLSSVLIDF
jgi:hypothetical protein